MIVRTAYLCRAPFVAGAWANLLDFRLLSISMLRVRRKASWVLPPGWTQPIPVTQFVAQYPWMQVDDRGQIRLKDDYKAWLDQQGAAQAAGLTSPAAVGGQASAAPGGSNAMVVPDGGVGYVPSSYLNVAPGMGTTSGLGQNAFGNGVSAGAAAHV